MCVQKYSFICAHTFYILLNTKYKERNWQKYAANRVCLGFLKKQTQEILGGEKENEPQEGRKKIKGVSLNKIPRQQEGLSPTEKPQETV